MRRLLAVISSAALLVTAAAAVAADRIAPGSDDDVLERVHARFTGSDLAGPSCRDVIVRAVEPGVAAINFQYQISGARRAATGRYGGRVTFSLGEVLITTPKSIAWPHMSRGDRERAEALRRAILHHEVGHVRVAEAVRDELNAREAIVEPDAFAFRAAADAVGREGFDLFKREEREYDALTDHGRKQHVAPGALAGADTLIVCR